MPVMITARDVAGCVPQEETMKHSKRLKCRSNDAGRMTGPARGEPARPEGGSEITERRGGDAEYWQARAERARKQSRRYKEPAVRDHFVKIAAGYDELARCARDFRIGAGKAEHLSRAAFREVTQAQHGFASDERRVRDALEDDEVREALRASRKHSRDANAT
jgi:hypothetical protein